MRKSTNHLKLMMTVFLLGFGLSSKGQCNLNAGWSNWIPGPNMMNFSNSTTGTVSGTTYTWNFGDGSTANTFNASHSYTANGVYMVTLYASNNSTPACTDSASAQVTINHVCNFNASFTYTNFIIPNPSGPVYVTHFKSTTTNTISSTHHHWSFGDMTSGTGAFISKQYFSPGTYTVVLTVMNVSVNPMCTDTAVQLITVVGTTCNLGANYSYSQGSGGQVNFTNASIGTNSNTTYSWNFGNGVTSNSSGNPSTTYLNGGVHTANLTISDSSSPTCSSVATQTINVTTVSCTANPNFTLTYGGSAGLWNAIPSYPWNVVAAQWSWGDNSTSNSLYTSHTYSATGNYNICLSVTVSCGASASACATYSVYRSSGQSIYQVNVVQPELSSLENPAGLANLQNKEFAFGIYPNPAVSEFMLMAQGLNGEYTKLIIMDAVGRVMISADQKNYKGNLMEIVDFSDQPAGLYFITIKSGDRMATKKVVLTK